MRRLGISLLLLSVPGCYETPSTLGLVCDVDDHCDGDQRCIDGTCRLAGRSSERSTLLLFGQSPERRLDPSEANAMTRSRLLTFHLGALALAAACNTTTTNSIETSGTDGPATSASDSAGESGSPGMVTELCESFFECGEAPEGFTQGSCEELVNNCKGPLTEADPGYFEEQIEACLAASACADFDACFGELLQSCQDATGAPACDEAETACDGNQIGACIEGQWQTYDCRALCAEDGLGYETCGFDDDSGHDVCWCAGSGGDPATCELGVNALCTCYECTDAEAQSFYDDCIAQGSDILACFADQVMDDSIVCETAAQMCAPA